MSDGSAGVVRAGTRTPPSVGDPAPPLEVDLLDGGRFRLEDHRGRPFLVVFLRHAG